MIQEEKIKEVKKFLENKPGLLRKKVSIIFDGKQYNIRIPMDFVKISQLNPDKDEFEFIMEIPEEKNELPKMYGELISKDE